MEATVEAAVVPARPRRGDESGRSERQRRKKHSKDRTECMYAEGVWVQRDGPVGGEAEKGGVWRAAAARGEGRNARPGPERGFRALPLATDLPTGFCSVASRFHVLFFSPPFRPPRLAFAASHRSETSRLLERLRDVEAVLPDASQLQSMLARSVDDAAHAEHELEHVRKELWRREEGERAFLRKVKSGVEDASRGAERIRPGSGSRGPHERHAHESAPPSARGSRHSPRNHHTAIAQTMSPNGGFDRDDVVITIDAIGHDRRRTKNGGEEILAPISPASSPSSSLPTAPARHIPMTKMVEDLAATQAALCRATRDLVLAANSRREAEARAREARHEARRERREMTARVLAVETACEERIAMAEEAAGRVKAEADRARRELAREAEGLRADLSIAREAAARLGREASDLRVRRARDAEGWVADVASLRRRLASLETRLRCDRLERTVKDPDARAVLSGPGSRQGAVTGGGPRNVEVSVDVAPGRGQASARRVAGRVAPRGPTSTSSFGSTRRLGPTRPRGEVASPPPGSPPAVQLAGIREALALLGDDLARRVDSATADARLPSNSIEIVVEEGSRKGKG